MCVSQSTPIKTGAAKRAGDVGTSQKINKKVDD